MLKLDIIIIASIRFIITWTLLRNSKLCTFIILSFNTGFTVDLFYLRHRIYILFDRTQSVEYWKAYARSLSLNISLKSFTLKHIYIISISVISKWYCCYWDPSYYRTRYDVIFAVTFIYDFKKIILPSWFDILIHVNITSSYTTLNILTIITCLRSRVLWE
jgi:hypothetical protein